MVSFKVINVLSKNYVRREQYLLYYRIIIVLKHTIAIQEEIEALYPDVT